MKTKSIKNGTNLRGESFHLQHYIHTYMHTRAVDPHTISLGMLLGYILLLRIPCMREGYAAVVPSRGIQVPLVHVIPTRAHSAVVLVDGVSIEARLPPDGVHWGGGLGGQVEGWVKVLCGANMGLAGVVSLVENTLVCEELESGTTGKTN